MERFFVLTEKDFRCWVKEAVEEGLRGLKTETPAVQDEPLISRKETAAMLKVSLVTLNDWVRRGLPSYKQRGRVYFLYSEVQAYIRNNSNFIVVANQ